MAVINTGAVISATISGRSDEMSEETLPGPEVPAHSEGPWPVLQQVRRQQGGGEAGHAQPGPQEGGEEEETKKGEIETDTQPHQSAAATETPGHQQHEHILGWRRWRQRRGVR